jgi:hypothetical protein
VADTAARDDAAKPKKKTYSFTLENYEEAEQFAKARGLKDVPTLARFAIAQYLSRSGKRGIGASD